MITSDAETVVGVELALDGLLLDSLRDDQTTDELAVDSLAWKLRIPIFSSGMCW